MIIKKIFLAFKLPVILSFLIGLEVFLLVQARQSLRLPERVTLLRNELRSQIDRRGSAAVYTDLIAQLKKATSDKQHTSVHIFGEELYRANGLGGVVFCDNAFGFGCFHGFFGKAVAKGGLAVVAKLDEACVERFGLQGLGCPHGIGHGLGEYFGPDKLNEQLAVCETLSWKGIYHGCQSGVFMEYNYPTIAGEENAVTTTRPFQPPDPYAPCLSVPERFRKACFFELPAWWWDALPHDVKKMGALCQDIGDTKFRESCFLGIGAGFAPRIEYSLPGTIENCHLMPNISSETMCRAGAAWAFFADPAFRDQSDSVCDGLSGKPPQQCKDTYQRIAQGGL